MAKRPDLNIELAEQLLPVDQIDHLPLDELPWERRIELAQAHALISIARSLRSIEQERGPNLLSPSPTAQPVS